MRLFTSIAGMIRFRYKLYYAELKSFISRGSFIYSINDKIKFICNGKDYFSKIIFISGGHEKLELLWCEKWFACYKNDSKIIDCGANIGFFSAYLAQTNPLCTILAIEGNINTFSILKKNILQLDLKNISLENAILAESLDQSYEIPDYPGWEPWQQAKSITGHGVKTLTLDRIVRDTSIPDFVKIDCEGFEVKILKGSSHLLKLCSAVFMVECNDFALKEAGTDRKELFELFISNNYKLFHLSSFDLNIPLGTEINNEFPSKEFNFVAIPDKPEFIGNWEKVLSGFKNKKF